MGEVILQAQAASRIELRREMLADIAAARRSGELDDDQDDVRKNWEELGDDDLELDGDEEVGRGEDQDDDFVLEDDGDLEQDGVSSRGRGEIAADMSDDETDSDGSTHSEVWSAPPSGRTGVAEKVPCLGRTRYVRWPTAPRVGPADVRGRSWPTAAWKPREWAVRNGPRTHWSAPPSGRTGVAEKVPFLGRVRYVQWPTTCRVGPADVRGRSWPPAARKRRR